MPAYAGAGKRKIYLWLYRNTVRKIMKPEKVTNEEKVRRKRMRIRIKKLAALGFAALLALQLAACADSGTPAKSEDSTTESQTKKYRERCRRRCEICHHYGYQQ